MSVEEPTQRLTVQPRDPAQDSAAQTTAALPRPLDLAGPTSPRSPEPADKTDELSLDEIFAAPPPARAEPAPAAPVRAEPPRADPPRAEEAPTWTAMPVIPVRSEPVSPRPAPTSRAQTEENAEAKAKRTGPSTGERLLSDASAALDGALRRTQAWMTHDDNGLMLMTAVVAIILILVVAAVGS
jgi:hypothetical protein